MLRRVFQFFSSRLCPNVMRTWLMAGFSPGLCHLSLRLCLKSWNIICNHSSQVLCSVKSHISFGFLGNKCEYKEFSPLSYHPQRLCVICHLLCLGPRGAKKAGMKLSLHLSHLEKHPQAEVSSRFFQSNVYQNI